MLRAPDERHVAKGLAGRRSSRSTDPDRQPVLATEREVRSRNLSGRVLTSLRIGRLRDGVIQAESEPDPISTLSDGSFAIALVTPLLLAPTLLDHEPDSLHSLPDALAAVAADLLDPLKRVQMIA
jgi:hypothetical protein